MKIVSPNARSSVQNDSHSRVSSTHRRKDRKGETAKAIFQGVLQNAIESGLIMKNGAKM